MRWLLCALLLCLSPESVAADTNQTVSIREWTVPFASGRPRDPSVAPDGSVWFVGQNNHYLGRFDPVTERFTKRQLDDNAGPHNLIVGTNGVVWYAGNRLGYIGRYDPVSDILDKINMPDRNASDPHTLVFDHQQQNIWFTVQWGNFVGRLNTQTLKVDLIKVPTPDARPYGIAVGPKGRLWIALLGTNKLASIDPETLVMTEFNLPDPDAGPRRITVTSAGMVYYVDFSLGRLGQLNPANQQVREWPSPSGAGAGPYAMAIDEVDRIWYVETGERPNMLIGFDPAQETYVSRTPVPSGGGSVRHMVYDRPSKTIWFGTDRGTLGRAEILP